MFLNGEPVRTKASTEDVSVRIEAFLRGNGLYDDGANFGSHSLKATLLSWAAKFGLPLAIRRTPGGHAKARESSVLSHSRDELAEPLHLLQDTLKRIHGGEFDPDATRSGRWVSTPGAATPPAGGVDGDDDGDDIFGDVDEVAADAVVVPTAGVGSDDDVSSSSSSSAKDSPCGGGSDDSEAEYEDVGFVLNLRTGVYHALAGWPTQALKCGLTWPHHCAPADFTAIIADDSRKCRKCFG